MVKANALNVGADVYLTKPVSRDISIDTIAKFQSESHRKT